MSLNITFAGHIVDGNSLIVPNAYIQALYIGENGIKLWDSEVRQVGLDGIYNLNLGDDTFATVSNLVKTNGSNGKLLLNAWSGNRLRSQVLSLMGSTYVQLEDKSVYVNDIQILPVSPISCGNWTLDNQYFIDEVIHSTSQNTNLKTYIYDNRVHYQYKELEGEVIFNSLGVIKTEWNFGNGFNTSPFHSYATAGTKTVIHRVSDLYRTEFVECPRDIKLFARVSGNITYSPSNPTVGNEVTLYPSVLFDSEYITNVRYVVNGVIKYSGLDFSSPFTYIPTEAGNDVVTFILRYNDGFESKIWSGDFTVVKSNIPPTMNLEVITPTVDNRYTFIHNGEDLDGGIGEVNYIIERNNKDIYNNDIWTVFYETGRITDLAPFTYDFAQETGDFRVTVVVYDVAGDSVSDSFRLIKECGIGKFDLSCCDWSKRIVKTHFSTDRIKVRFTLQKFSKIWDMKPRRIEWTVNRNVQNWDITKNQITFRTR